MPGATKLDGTAKKRKRVEIGTNGKQTVAKSRKAPKTTSSGTGNDNDDVQEKILLLESQTLESRSNYNNIIALQRYVSSAEIKTTQTAITAAVSLCRIFCRLIASEALVKRKSDSLADTEVRTWLKQRLRDYAICLSHSPWVGGTDGTMESTALTLLMRIVKSEVLQGGKKAETAWRNQSSVFRITVEAIMSQKEAELARSEFVDNFVEEFDDVRFYTFLAVKEILAGQIGSEEVVENYVEGAINLLAAFEGIPTKQDELQDWYGGERSDSSHQLLSLSAHRKLAQEAWLAVFRAPLSQAQRKRLLSIATRQILPWFPNRLEHLADFLTSSFSAGGSSSLLALSGIFHLMTNRNLDYPDFYTKLYSLLDEQVLHSKHRSRFFRHMSLFLSSSHLPATLVASFIKRLARLALQAPPGAIVYIIPWTYNILRSHPTCTFMIHRPYHPAHLVHAAHTESSGAGIQDPFSMEETDPNITNAIESSLWELETLMSHYHPNVATLAKILGEQFTKRDYVLEDFLDHSFASLVEGELARNLKSSVEVEWEIPKRIFTTEEDEEGGDGLNAIGRLFETVSKGNNVII
ncbi:nucleolar complex protein 4 [Polychaeton citri CBS 116435]|uniref:Nucleolar complex protein 4 n=1 Tax=Polychaeton citri CBS 116435 TaxID=1314669 RepID=A0A9P4USH2_9PEZI|nr:nucleolar complex protein 4 [Polychaeton citri CBS 116435]